VCAPRHRQQRQNQSKDAATKNQNKSASRAVEKGGKGREIKSSLEIEHNCKEGEEDKGQEAVAENRGGPDPINPFFGHEIQDHVGSPTSQNSQAINISEVHSARLQKVWSGEHPLLCLEKPKGNQRNPNHEQEEAKEEAEDERASKVIILKNIS